jgi:hypothetical protein
VDFIAYLKIKEELEATKEILIDKNLLKSIMKGDKDFNGERLITMHLPSSMFESVIDILRNEKPVEYTFAANRASIRTGIEPVGEEE